jgi:transcriptional regulator with XRE-family HTH domain
MSGLETVSETLGARIRTERTRIGLTVRALAGRAGVSASLISQIERGRATPSVATLWAVLHRHGDDRNRTFDTQDAHRDGGGKGSEQ